jgi:hypothetical protein
MKETTVYVTHTGHKFEAEKLLKCPFCGYEPELLFIGNDYSKKRSVEIKCTNKNCRINVVTSGIKSSSQQVALWSIEIWNKRVNE